MRDLLQSRERRLFHTDNARVAVRFEVIAAAVVNRACKPLVVLEAIQQWINRFLTPLAPMRRPPYSSQNRYSRSHHRISLDILEVANEQGDALLLIGNFGGSIFLIAIGYILRHAALVIGEQSGHLVEEREVERCVGALERPVSRV